MYDLVVKISSDFEILLCGDFNVRTGTTPTFDTYFMGSNGDLDRLLSYDFSYPHQLREGNT